MYVLGIESVMVILTLMIQLINQISITLNVGIKLIKLIAIKFVLKPMYASLIVLDRNVKNVLVDLFADLLNGLENVKRLLLRNLHVDLSLDALKRVDAIG